MLRILNFKFKIKNSQSGFTLIEAVVATAVFAFVVTSTLGVYLSTIQLDRKSRAQRAITQNARFIMEFLAKEVRNGRINYASYPGGVVSTTTDLYLENQANIIERLFLSGTDLVLSKFGAVTTTTNMNSAAVKVTNLKFFIQPSGDPYTGAKTFNEQPHVTVVLGLSSNYGTSSTDVVRISLQDTFATRTYPSRELGGAYTTPTYPSPVGDVIAPVVTAFDVQPRVTLTSVTATFSATDTGGAHLNYAELWRATARVNCTISDDTGCNDWASVATAAGNNLDAWSDTMSDTPPSGSYIYGLRVYDNSNNVGVQSTKILIDASSVQNVAFLRVAGVSVTANNLTKTAAIGWGNAGASSSQMLASGDGYIEFTATETNTYRYGALTHNDPSLDQTSINYGWYLQVGGVLSIVENGALLSSITYAASDVLKISVVSGVVKYYQNGILRYTSLQAPVYPLLFDTALYSPNATITNAKISGNVITDTTLPVVSAFDVQPRTPSGSVTATFTASDAGSQHLQKAELWRATARVNCTISDNTGCNDWASVSSTTPAVNVIMQNTSGVSVAGNSVTKTAAGGWGNAGATSTQTISSGDGYVEFNATLSIPMIGLTTNSTVNTYTQVTYGLQPSVGTNTMNIYEAGVYRGTFNGGGNPTDLYRVAVESGVVKYYLNGILFYTSTVPPTYPLMFGAALYTTGESTPNVKIYSAIQDSWSGALFNVPSSGSYIYGIHVYDHAGNLGLEPAKIKVDSTSCANGGVMSTSGGYNIHTFLSSGSFTVTCSRNVEILVVAGGGGGGMDMGGGGGGGGVIYNSSYAVTPQTYAVTVGAGGAGAPAASTGGQPAAHQYTIPAQNGGNSIFGTLTAIGGGFGGSSYYAYTPGASGNSGGSGGGSSGYSDTSLRAGGTGTAGQGNNGGQGGGQYYSGGGGGAGGLGASSPAQPNGGIGVLNAINGTALYWGGGGGGASYTLATGGNGGNGGGGGGAVGVTTGGAGLNPGSPGGGGTPVAQTNTPGGNAGANTGGGGGGGSHYNANNKGGNGGSGIVIIRYLAVPDGSVPVVSAFDVNPKFVAGPVTGTFTATDSGGSHFQKAELWRAVYNASTCSTTVATGCTWTIVSTITAGANLDSWSGTFPADSPAVGMYVYGVHVYDNAGSFGLEPAKIRVDIATIVWGNGSDITTSSQMVTTAPGSYLGVYSPKSGKSDVDGDGKTDIQVFRPSTGEWFFVNSSTGTGSGATYGGGGDIPVPGDYNNDGITEIAVWRPGDGNWFVNGSATVSWGGGGDIPVPGDWDGNGSTDRAVYRPSTAVWYSMAAGTFSWGAPGGGDIPVPGDYDGDGKMDPAVYRPGDGFWHVLKSTSGYSAADSNQWGVPGDIPTPGDYDGDGKTDRAVYRPSTGEWLQTRTTTGFAVVVWGGESNYIPVPGDYSGGGTTDIAIFRPSTGAWLVAPFGGAAVSTFATGGTVTSAGGYRIHTFTASGTFNLTSVKPGGTVEYLVVGGGGGGGGATSGSGSAGGGGGGGGVGSNTSAIAIKSYAVVVGGGGAGGIGATRGANGADSYINTILGVSGGGGGAGGGVTAVAGGSGGGGSHAATAGAAGVAGQGTAGGVGTSVSGWAGGGGGGANAVGGAAGAGGGGGVGGAGRAVFGATYGGGGGGGFSCCNGAGGAGGGGAGTSGTGGNGVANTGGGGGGGGSTGGSRGGNGGSGIVIIRYLFP